MGVDEIPVIGPLWLNGVLCLLGFIVHATTKWREFCKAIAPVGFVAFIKADPSAAAVSVSTSALAFVGTWSLGWMNPGMAIGCGYMATSIVNKIVQRNVERDP